MSNAYHKLWIHLIWSTKDRYPYLTKSIRNKIIFHIKEKANDNGIYIDTINGMEDHLHCLVGLEPKQSISSIVNVIKGESSHWINEEKLTGSYFAWQKGYSAFSYGESQVESVRKYIQEQEQHHKKATFQEELDKFLELFHAKKERP